MTNVHTMKKRAQKRFARNARHTTGVALVVETDSCHITLEILSGHPSLAVSAPVAAVLIQELRAWLRSIEANHGNDGDN